ncbi:mediator of RNA polymerase II transcription subunit 9-like protein [Leptotrombidium deliense]|uniref:Mediator of RNA polymerase II transcription subunit 9 n=1 Tax=Leptotrombidium deliense TaxID=299467 RepID=A0A443SMP3_9ACAR|nr:mediator of RNA polymerase II transcription subunit 9-like protein [Leptotrombidium deliense]
MASNVDQIDSDFLPAIYDIVRSIEREMNDNNSKTVNSSKDQYDCHQKMLLLKEKFQKFRELVMKVEGIDCRKEEQLNRYDAFKEQLQLKRELLLRYKHCSIDTSKI